jgi:hypothetical protein
MSNIASLAVETTDVQFAGARATAEHGLSANYWFKGNKAGLTHEVIANKFQTIFTYADNYRQRFIPEMLAAYAQYNGEPVATGKEPWQSNIHVPMPSQAINVASGRIVQSIFNSEDFFQVDPDRRADDLLTEFAKKSVKWQIRKSGGLKELKTSIKDALICGFGPLKVHFSVDKQPFTDVRRKTSRLSLPGQIISTGNDFEYVDSYRTVKKMRFESGLPTDLWLDPSGKNRWLIQRTTRYPSDLWPLTEDLYGPDGELLRKKVYDAAQVSRVRPGMQDGKRLQDAAVVRREQGTAYGQNYDQACDIYEFWGDFPDPDTGATLFRNVIATFVDRRLTIRYPQRNPFLHGMPPFICFQSQLLPHQVYGYGLLQQNRTIEDAINRQANVLLDKSMLQVPTLEYDASASKDPAIQAGSRPKFAPGKMWPRKPGPDKKIFYPVEGFQPVMPIELAMLDRLTNWYQLSSTVPEFASGAQLSNNRKTAEEARLRTAAAQQNFNDAAVHIEEQGIGPFLKMVYLTMVQYEDQYDDITLTKMFGDDQDAISFIQELRAMSPQERWASLYLDAEFKAVGITNEITRQERLQELSDFIRVTSADPLLSMTIDKREQLKEMLQLYHQPQRLVLKQSDAILQAVQFSMLQQMFGGAMGGGAMGPAAAPGGMPLGGKKTASNPHNSLASVAGEAGRS